MSYGSLCVKCRHLGSRHLVKLGDQITGPYRCLDCDCEIDQDAALTPISKREYEEMRDGGLPTYETAKVASR